MSEATIYRLIERLRLSRKKIGRSERDEWLRLVWHSALSTLSCNRLMFVDEMGAHTSLAPLYGYSPRGHRAFLEVPRNRGPNPTLLARMTIEGMRPSMDIEGSTTKEVFEA